MELYLHAGAGRASSSTPRRSEIQLQGPRPAPLKLHRDSHKITKPLPAPSTQPAQRRLPVIIYTVSPKVIHTNPSEFMSLVQRLTGCSAASSSPSFRQAAGVDNHRNSNEVLNCAEVSGYAGDIGYAELPQELSCDTDELRRLCFDHFGQGSCSSLPGMSPAVRPPAPPNHLSPTMLDVMESINLAHQELVGAAVPGWNYQGFMESSSFSASPGGLLFSVIDQL
ncbi:Protein MKS1 [Apostasia shenzhenica]|uniref:Protein MKS1 n=1 Tax=Apostasia shenzhenica TaxID=1088818 RepID=A0A2I0BG65_9ASPA|nr:Protein MKS1 [Apostasia shenzhenica]